MSRSLPAKSLINSECISKEKITFQELPGTTCFMWKMYKGQEKLKRKEITRDPVSELGFPKKLGDKDLRKDSLYGNQS